MMFFFFKQKTAYVMRISDWSSDVCSSDLLEARADQRFGQDEQDHERACRDQPERDRLPPQGKPQQHQQRCYAGTHGRHLPARKQAVADARPRGRDCADQRQMRSEEHTSELQSLMRNSYAVFFLKNKKRTIK